jgi:hypothetical protein
MLHEKLLPKNPLLKIRKNLKSCLERVDKKNGCIFGNMKRFLCRTEKKVLRVGSAALFGFQEQLLCSIKSAVFPGGRQNSLHPSGKNGRQLGCFLSTQLR